MIAVYALYSDPAHAERAFEALQAGASELGIEARKIAVISSEPFDEYALERPHARTLMPWVAAVAGLLAGAGGCWLTAFTQKAYPLPTGGMPIVTPWANTIIIYELTMLGAILATLVTFLPSARLPGWGRKLYDPEIGNGRILVGVVDPPHDARAEVAKLLSQHGAEQIKQFPPADSSMPGESNPSNEGES